MCQQCCDAMNEIYPNLTDEEKGELAMGATAFPFCDATIFRNQLIDIREHTDGTLIGALCYAEDQMRLEMEAYKKREAEKDQAAGVDRNNTPF